MKRHNVLALISACFISFGTHAAEAGFYLGVEGGQSRAEIGADSRALVAQQGIPVGASSDERDATLGLYLGYALSKHFAIEIAYSDLGESRYTAERDINLGFPLIPDSGAAAFVPNPSAGFFVGNPVAGVALIPTRQQTTLDSKSFALSLIGRYPLAETVSFIGRAGLSTHRLEADLRAWFDEREITVIAGDLEESAAAALVGAGVEWDLHPKWHVRLQVQRHFMFDDAQFVRDVKRGDITTFTVGAAYRF
jgi:opacity protein-like surface antigen